MANTAVTYQGNGVTTDFVITFDYLARKFARVDIDGTPQTNGVEYNFIDARTISFVSAPAAGTLVTIRRNTSATERIVEFRDASVLKSSDLDLSSLQTFHIAEEAKDLVLDTIGTNEDGDLDARFRKIVNLKDGVNPNDAINYGQYTEDREGTYQAAKAAKASEVAAKASEVAAKASEDNAKASEVTASASAATAVVAAMDAQQSESDTLALKNQAQQIVDTAQGTLDQIAEISAMVNEVKGARLPVGVIVSFPKKGDYPGYLYLDGSSFDKAIYKQLAVLYPSGVLPDLRSSTLTGVDDGKGKFTNKTANTFLESANLSHTHTGSATQGGAHGHTGSASAGGSHGHTVNDPGHTHNTIVDTATSGGNFAYRSTNTPTGTSRNIGAATTGISINAGGAHTHDVTIAEGGAHTHNVTVAASGGTESRPYSYTVYWYIKAVDSVGQPEVIQAQDLVNRVAALEAKGTQNISEINLLKQSVDDIRSSVTTLTQRVTTVEGVANYAVAKAEAASSAVSSVFNAVYKDVTSVRSKNTAYTAGPKGRHVIIQWNVSSSHTVAVYIGPLYYTVSNSASSTPIIAQFWVPANTDYAVSSSTIPPHAVWLETNA